MKNKFLNISIGVTMMLLGAGFFVRSIHSANANPPSPKEFIEEGTNKIGKYNISIAMTNDGGGTEAMVIDTETGQTAYYYILDNGSDWKKNAHQIPSNPLGN